MAGYNERNDGNSPQYQPAGIGKPGDTRGMGQYITDELPRMIRTRTLAELQELITGLRANYKAIGLTREQAQQAVALVEQRIAQTSPGGPAPASPPQMQGVPQTSPGGPAPASPPQMQGIPTTPTSDKDLGYPRVRPPTTDAEAEQMRAQALQERDRITGQIGTALTAPLDRSQTGDTQFNQAVGAEGMAEMAVPETPEAAGAPDVPALAAAPLKEYPNGPPGPLAEFVPPREGKKSDKDYDGMTVKEFMEVGDVLHIAINGKGLRNDGGKFVPVGS